MFHRCFNDGECFLALPQERIERAFARTFKHPDLPGIRMTENPEDLCAVFMQGVRGVEWVKEYPSAVVDELRDIDHEQYEDGFDAYAALCAAPPAIQQEIRKNADIFAKVAALDDGEINSESLYSKRYGPHPSILMHQPHTDGFKLRFLDTYTLNPALMTDLYPLSGKDEIGLCRFAQTLMDAPLNEWESIKQQHGRRKVGLAHAFILKGEVHNPKDDWCIHSSATPLPGGFSLIWQQGINWGAV
jgi:hypothetical protein